VKKYHRVYLRQAFFFFLDIFHYLVFMQDFKVAAFLMSRVKMVQDRVIVTVEHYQ